MPPPVRCGAFGRTHPNSVCRLPKRFPAGARIRKSRERFVRLPALGPRQARTPDAVARSDAVAVGLTGEPGRTLDFHGGAAYSPGRPGQAGRVTRDRESGTGAGVVVGRPNMAVNGRPLERAAPEVNPGMRTWSWSNASSSNSAAWRLQREMGRTVYPEAQQPVRVLLGHKRLPQSDRPRGSPILDGGMS